MMAGWWSKHSERGCVGSHEERRTAFRREARRRLRWAAFGAPLPGLALLSVVRRVAAGLPSGDHRGAERRVKARVAPPLDVQRADGNADELERLACWNTAT